MTFAHLPWRSDARVAASFAFSLVLHLGAIFVMVPTLSVLPRTILPSIDVRLVELTPPAPIAETPAAPPQETAQDAVPVPQPEPERAVAAPQEMPVLTRPAPAEPALAEKPPAADPEPQAPAEPALTDAERAKINPRYLAEAEVDTKLVSLDEAREPEYPPEALEKGLTGCVLVMVYIGANGMVENIDVVRSDPPEIFDRNAMRAFINRRYLPAMKGNTPVRSRVPGVASFELEGKPRPLCALRYFPLVQELNGYAIKLGQDAKQAN